VGKTAIIFPGQASQYVGMGRDLYESDSRVKRLYEIASDAIGEDIAKLSFQGPEERLKETRFTQPAILLHSLAVLIIAGDSLPKADFTAGHSLGEYGSLVLSGMLEAEESLKAVVKRSSLMETACQEEPGTMAAIMGLSEAKLNEICKKASAEGVVVPANYNSSNQIVVSGSVSGVEEVCRLAKEAGARRAVKLQVGGAFHSPLMRSAREGMGQHLAPIDFRRPDFPIIPNVTGLPEKDSTKIKELLVEQLTSPVRWHDTMQFLAANEVDTVIEVGPGKVLSGLAKRELPEAQIVNMDTLEDIAKFNAVIEG